MDSKVRATFSLDKKVKEDSKRVASERRKPLSGIIENFLKFFVNPEVYCFKCGFKFALAQAKLCLNCGWMRCPKCNVCRCQLNEETTTAVFNMRRVYEDLLSTGFKVSSMRS